MPKCTQAVTITLAGVAALLTAACSSSTKSSAPTPPTSKSPSTSTSANTTGTTNSLPASTTATSGTGTDTGTGTGACSLATSSDVSTTYGEQFGAGQQSSPGGYSNCLFPPPSGAIDSVSFTVAQSSQADLFYSANQSAYDSSPLSGIGDKAFVSKDGGAIGVEKGGTSFLVHVVGFEKLSASDLQAKQEAFAKLLLSRLA